MYKLLKKNESFIDQGLEFIIEKPALKQVVPETSKEKRCFPFHVTRAGEELEFLEAHERDEPAIVLKDPLDVIVLRDSTAVLSVSYRGHPEPTVRWLQAGRLLVPSDRIRIKTEKGLSSLTLENITADQAGKYAVFVENSLGRDWRYSSVAVEGPPESPAGVPIVSACNVDNEVPSVNVAWCSPSYDGGCALTGYAIEMRQIEDESWTLVSETYHSLNHTIAGLLPDETYLFRVRAINIHGASEPSVESAPFIVRRKIENEEEMRDQMSDKESEEETFCEKNMENTVVSLEDGKIFLDRFEVMEELGKGRYGIVKRVIEKSTGHEFASKFVKTIKATDRKQVREEIKIMNLLKHPKLLRLAAAFENPREIIMITEYISGGELFERVVADDFTLTEKDSILFMRQICEGVKYMHKNNVVHLDLKPENIMCRTRTSHSIKLIDFGLAQILKPNVPIRVLFGTPEFIPPEIISYEPIGTESDMWSVGIICYVLLSGLSPFMGNNDAETFANITRADYDFDDEAFDAISQDAKDFIGCLLIKRKGSRMSAKECLEHSWLAQHTENMSRVALSTEKLKKFLVRRKWQKTGNALRALGRMSKSANSRRSPSQSSASSPILKETFSFESSQDEQSSSTRESSFDENEAANEAFQKEAKLSTIESRNKEILAEVTRLIPVDLDIEKEDLSKFNFDEVSVNETLGESSRLNSKEDFIDEPSEELVKFNYKGDFTDDRLKETREFKSEHVLTDEVLGESSDVDFTKVFVKEILEESAESNLAQISIDEGLDESTEFKQVSMDETLEESVKFNSSKVSTGEVLEESLISKKASVDEGELTKLKVNDISVDEGLEESAEYNPAELSFDEDLEESAELNPRKLSFNETTENVFSSADEEIVSSFSQLHSENVLDPTNGEVVDKFNNELKKISPGEETSRFQGDKKNQNIQKQQVRFSIDVPNLDEDDSDLSLDKLKLSRKTEDNKNEAENTTGVFKHDDFENGVRTTVCDLNPLHEDDNCENTRIIKSSQGRNYLHTGNVNRTAKIFERKGTESLAGCSVNEKPTRPISRMNTQKERIQKAFAFWNK